MSANDLTHGLLEVEQIGDCTIGRFTRRTILESGAIETIAARLRALVREEGHRLIVLNFARVESVTSAMLGTFLSIHKEVEANGGRVVFCNVDSFLLQIFQLCKVPQQVPIYADEAAAMAALALPA